MNKNGQSNPKPQNGANLSLGFSFSFFQFNYSLFLSESSLPFIFILRPQNFTSKVESFCGLRKFQDLDAFFEVPGQITSKFSGT